MAIFNLARPLSGIIILIESEDTTNHITFSWVDILSDLDEIQNPLDKYINLVKIKRYEVRDSILRRLDQPIFRQRFIIAQN